MIRISQSDLRAVDLERLRPFAADREEFFGPKQHYRLLAHLSTLVGDGPIVAVGTHRGASALALSYGGRTVHSFDVVDKTSGRPRPAHVHHHVDDVFDLVGRGRWLSTLLGSSLIVIDVDPHDGAREYEFVDWLRTSGYRGLIVLDDIWYFKPMRDHLWYRIEPRHRVDATSVGHWSGTGLVSFVDHPPIVEGTATADTSNWSLVTGYFDLTGRSDSNDAIRARPAAHYIDQHGASTLALDQNLVVFCEPQNEERVWSMRPSWLHHRTRVVVQAFDDFPLAKYHGRIVQNRGGPACPTDPRNTASYYLFCMARYAMLQRTIEKNPFRSTHFAWVNVCIERMGFNNLVYMRDALAQQRDKFSTCFIDYVPQSVTDDLSAYYAGRACVGRCSMCSGFFTGRGEFMYEVCSRLEREFVRCAEAGYGHADEQLYPIAYFRQPDLFDWYPGDYAEMVTNYSAVRERPEQPVRNLIQNSLSAGDVDVCARACRALLDSLRAGDCTIGQHDLDALARACRQVGVEVA